MYQDYKDCIVVAKDQVMPPPPGPDGKPRRRKNRSPPIPRIKLNTPTHYDMPVVNPKRELTAAEKRQQAWDMRLEGHAVVTISDALGISTQRVYEMLNEYSADMEKYTDHNVKTWITQQLAVLDKLLVAHWKDRELPKHAQIILQTLERKHKLLGLETTNKNIKVDTGPVGVTLNNLDLSRLTDEELGWLELIIAKALPQEAPLQAIDAQFVALPAPEEAHG